MPDYVKEIEQINWSWEVTGYVAQGTSDFEFEMLSDLDSMAINVGLSQSNSKRLIYLDKFVIDLDNMIAYTYHNKAAKIGGRPPKKMHMS